jgi:hypothetical protein
MRRGGTAFSCAPGPHRRGELIETASGDFRRRSPKVRQNTSDLANSLAYGISWWEVNGDRPSISPVGV